MIDGVRAELGEDGCALLAGFVRADGVGALAAEAERVAPKAHRAARSGFRSKADVGELEFRSCAI